MAEKLIAPNIGIAEKSRKDVVQILFTLLADECVLYTKTKEVPLQRNRPKIPVAS